MIMKIILYVEAGTLQCYKFIDDNDTISIFTLFIIFISAKFRGKLKSYSTDKWKSTETLSTNFFLRPKQRHMKSKNWFTTKENSFRNQFVKQHIELPKRKMRQHNKFYFLRWSWKSIQTFKKILRPKQSHKKPKNWFAIKENSYRNQFVKQNVELPKRKRAQHNQSYHLPCSWYISVIQTHWKLFLFAGYKIILIKVSQSK